MRIIRAALLIGSLAANADARAADFGFDTEELRLRMNAILDRVDAPKRVQLGPCQKSVARVCRLSFATIAMVITTARHDDRSAEEIVIVFGKGSDAADLLLGLATLARAVEPARSPDPVFPPLRQAMEERSSTNTMLGGTRFSFSMMPPAGLFVAATRPSTR